MTQSNRCPRFYLGVVAFLNILPVNMQTKEQLEVLWCFSINVLLVLLVIMDTIVFILICSFIPVSRKATILDRVYRITLSLLVRIKWSKNTFHVSLKTSAVLEMFHTLNPTSHKRTFFTRLKKIIFTTPGNNGKIQDIVDLLIVYISHSVN